MTRGSRKGQVKWALALGVGGAGDGLERGGGFGPCSFPMIPSTFALSYTLFSFQLQGHETNPTSAEASMYDISVFQQKSSTEQGRCMKDCGFFLLVYMSLLQLNFFYNLNYFCNRKPTKKMCVYLMTIHRNVACPGEGHARGGGQAGLLEEVICFSTFPNFLVRRALNFYNGKQPVKK